MLEMMSFEGRDKVMQTVAQNGSLFQQAQQLGQIAMALAMQSDAASGGQRAAQVQQIMAQMGMAAPTPPAQQEEAQQ